MLDFLLFHHCLFFFSIHPSHSDPGTSLSRISSSAVVDSSTERLMQDKQYTQSSLLCDTDFSYGSDPLSPSTLPQNYATTASASSRDSQLDSLMTQHSDVVRKKEVFLDNLRQKYPHHAAIIMGHQDRMREQVRKTMGSRVLLTSLHKQRLKIKIFKTLVVITPIILLNWKRKHLGK